MWLFVHEIPYLGWYFSSSCHSALENSSFWAVALHLNLSQTRERIKVLGLILRSPWKQCGWDHHLYRSSRMVGKAGLWTDAPVQSSVKKTYRKALPEPFYFRILWSTCLEHQEELFQEGLGWNLPHASLWLRFSDAMNVALLHLMYVISGQLRAQQSKLNTAQDAVPGCLLCSLCLFLTSGTWLDIKQGITKMEERILDTCDTCSSTSCNYMHCRRVDGIIVVLLSTWPFLE